MLPRRRKRAPKALLNGHLARRNAAPGTVDYVVWDTVLAGFGLQVRASGNNSWIVQYRQCGKLKKVTLARELRHSHHNALTGCRHSEILNLKWSDIHGLRIKLTDAKTGRRTVWLGTEARAVIDHLALTRHPKVEWLFWNWRVRKQIKTVGVYWHQVQERAGIMGLRVHDIRHSFASHAVQRAEPIPMVGRLLGHAKVSSTLRYDGHALAASQCIADAIEKTMDDGLPQVYPTTKYDVLDWSRATPLE